ncbi:MAG: efflux RND transporter permease subunit [Gammaproteobacteria bacterium]|nr:efflux RND transporter permease subunit [Gammaproteobacteria bacterium]
MINWFVRNPVAANLLMVIILVLGAHAAFNRIPLEEFPSFESDMVTIGLAYRGATPAEVEQSLVIRVEEAITDLDGIKKMTSVAAEGMARIRVEVLKGVDPHQLLEDIRARVDVISTFPDGVERATFSVVVFRREVINVVVSGELSERELRRYGEEVRDELAALPMLNQVELNAVRSPEISIELSEQVLNRYELTFDAVVQAIQRSSVDLPAGSIRTESGEILLRTQGQAYAADDFAAIVLRARADGSRLTLGDVARIDDGFEQNPLAMYFDGKPGVLVKVFRAGDQSTLAIGQVVKDYITRKNAQLPANVSLGKWQDRSHIVKMRLQTLLDSAWQGGLLIFLILALFLRLSVALWVCAGIPISFMGALWVMPELGVTINIISLFAFILVLGIVVDDAIVTSENIFSHLKRSEDPLEAAVRGAQEVSVPVTFGLLTTVVAFAPLLFVDGYRGLIFAQIPTIVIPVLLFSWIESRLILPAHLRHVRVEHQQKKLDPLSHLQRKVANGLDYVIKHFYQPLLASALRQRYLTLALFIAVSFVVISFAMSGRYAFTFFPRVESEIAYATLVMQSGTPEQVTAQHLGAMAKAAEVLRDRYVDSDGNSVISNIMINTGWSGGGGTPSANGNEDGLPVGSAELGQVSLALVPPEERKMAVSTRELVHAWRRAVGEIPGARGLTYRAEIGRGGDPVDVQLAGPDFAVLKEIAGVVREQLHQYPGVYEIRDNFEDGKPEIKLTVRPEAELLGLSTTELGRQVRQAFLGAEAQRIQRGRDDVRVMVRYPEAERRDLGSLDTMRIRTADGTRVPFGNVAAVEMGHGFSSIRRVDRRRVVNVTADLDKKTTDASAITRDLRRFMDELLLKYPGVSYSLEGEQREQGETFGSLVFGALFTLFAIYALLAIPFRSYVQPLLVLIVIPFSIVGALLGHMVMGLNLNVLSLLGMLALAGVVVNDSLVLVDWINRKRREGMRLDEALRTAGGARFRPILLTSLTTFAGLTPLLLDKSTQAQFLIPMAVSLGFGILYATFLTLLLIPTGYRILEDAKQGVRRLLVKAPNVHRNR